jgi:Flp pilus assembly protein TadD
VVAGNGVANHGAVDERFSVYDVAPSVMALLGLPADEGWEGGLLPGIGPLEIDPIDYRSLLPATSYLPAVSGATPRDPEQIAKLRALGYLSAEPDDTPGRGLGGPENRRLSNGTAAGATPGQLANLGLVLIDRKQYGEAEQTLRAAIDLNPDSAVPHNHLRRLYMETGRWDEADLELWTAVDKGSTLAESRVNQAALDYEKRGQSDRVDAILSEGIRRYPDREAFWTRLISLRIDSGRCREAVDVGREAAERFPESARVFAYYGFAAACAGDIATGRRALERSLELDPGQPELRRALAQFPGR